MHDGTTLRDARDAYFEANGFGPDGGYADAWVDFELGPVPFPFPNTKGRVRAVRFHDLHHVVTGYRTDPVGELEIGAWEMAAGCWDFPAAVHLNAMSVVGGALVAPRRTFRAWVRGRRGRSLYRDEPYDTLLGRTVGEAKARCLPPGDAGPGAPLPFGARDVATFALAAAGGLVAGLATLPLAFALLPVGLVNLARKRAAQRDGRPIHAPAHASPQATGETANPKMSATGAARPSITSVAKSAASTASAGSSSVGSLDAFATR